MSGTPWRVAGVVAGLALLAAIGPRIGTAAVPGDDRPSVVIVLTDDQSAESLPHDPPVMPYLEGRLRDPADHWVVFPNAFVNTPMCCPSGPPCSPGASHATPAW